MSCEPRAQKVGRYSPPGTKIPCRQTICAPHLEPVREKEEQKVCILFKDMPCTIALDRWSTAMNEPVAGIALHSGGKSYLVNTVNTSGEPIPIEY